MASGYKILKVEPLPVEEALARGINFVSESFIFGVAGALLVFEYQRSEAKSAAKAQQQADDERIYREYLDGKFMHVYKEIKSITSRLDEIEKRLDEDDRRKTWFPTIKKSSKTNKPIRSDEDESVDTSSQVPEEQPLGHSSTAVLDELDNSAAVNADSSPQVSEATDTSTEVAVAPTSSWWLWRYW
jgi:hypothetical protein